MIYICIIPTCHEILCYNLHLFQARTHRRVGVEMCTVDGAKLTLEVLAKEIGSFKFKLCWTDMPYLLVYRHFAHTACCRPPRRRQLQQRVQRSLPILPKTTAKVWYFTCVTKWLLALSCGTFSTGWQSHGRSVGESFVVIKLLRCTVISSRPTLPWLVAWLSG